MFERCDDMHMHNFKMSGQFYTSMLTIPTASQRPAAPGVPSHPVDPTPLLSYLTEF